MTVVGFINTLANLLVLLVIIEVAVSYFLSPYHPVRHTLERLVEPMLAPIRRVVPPLGGFDLSPLILIILVEIIANALNYFVRAL
jgi:YggT family protein